MEKSKDSKKIYVCTPLATGKFNLKQIQETLIHNGVFAFIPPTDQLNEKAIGAKVDKQMIELCDELWAFGPIGRDCAWEIGYANGLGKKVKLFVDMMNEHVVQDDWMTVLNIEIVRMHEAFPLYQLHLSEVLS